MHIPRGRRHWDNKKTLFYLFSCWLYGALSYALWFSSHHVFVLDMHISLCYCAPLNACSGWSFALLCDHCSHLYMTVLVYNQVAHMFHIMFTWLQFTCYILPVLLLLALPWGSNVFCVSVSGYKYICSKCITASHHFEGGETLCTFSLYCLSFYSMFCVCTHVLL